MNTEPARTFPDAVVTAKCIDCGLEFRGPLGVRFIDPPAEGPGLEIVVVEPKRNEIHAIARIEIQLVPVVHEARAPLPPTGSA